MLTSSDSIVLNSTSVISEGGGQNLQTFHTFSFVWPVQEDERKKVYRFLKQTLAQAKLVYLTSG